MKVRKGREERGERCRSGKDWRKGYREEKEGGKEENISEEGKRRMQKL